MTVLEVDRLSKAFGGIVVADQLSIAVRAGEILGLIGPNGAGKTSLLNLISGAVRGDSGTIRLNVPG
jgi:branched-chain amino acid transport system ATP-binding protein